MPWKPSYTREEAIEAIADAESWADALRSLGVAALGKNFATIRKWAGLWELDSSHLAPYRPRPNSPRFTEAQVREAVANARSWSEALRRLGYCPTGGNPRTLKKWVEQWDISTDHFDPRAAMLEALEKSRRRKPLSEILTTNSTFSRSNLKKRLYEEGVKAPICELCGQDEFWRGKQMALILDHINGVRDDNRLENLRIVCPNCAATFETHCGRKLRFAPPLRNCVRCGVEFRPKYRDHRYCSQECGSRWDRRAAARQGRGQYGRAKPRRRKAARPPYEQLLREIEATSYLAVGRKYGVSDNAVRKWVRFYERQMERDAADAAREQGQLELLDEAA